jgi:hypothetical protein
MGGGKGPCTGRKGEEFIEFGKISEENLLSCNGPLYCVLFPSSNRMELLLEGCTTLLLSLLFLDDDILEAPSDTLEPKVSLLFNVL